MRSLPRDRSWSKLTRLRPITAVGVAVVLLALSARGTFDSASRQAFDVASTIWPVRPRVPGAIIVAIDEPSFSAIGKPWPWPRQLHAQLIQSLRRAGARTIAFDIVFAEPTTAEDDAAFASAIDDGTILAADESDIETPQGTMHIRTEPDERLTQKGGRTATVSLALDPDGTARRIPRYPDSLPRQILRSSGASFVEPIGTKLIQFFGGPRTYPYVSYYQALDPEGHLAPGFFRGRDIVVGFAVQASPELRTPDLFETPYTFRTDQLTAGPEVQATIADNLLHRLWISPARGWLTLLVGLAGCAAGFVVSMPERVTFRVGSILAAAGLTVVAAWLALRFGRLWLSPVEPMVGLIATSGLLGFADFSAERQRRRQIQSAFGQYVAPQIVRRIIEDPEQVRLGGERKTITALFADVRGFTGISEALQTEPERLTALINEILTPLSEIVIRNGGTIDKYIGDCVMAFWNAPLDDPDHGRHAVSAALEMIDSVSSLDQRLRTSHLAGTDLSVKIGIGINTGPCVVGNMGSNQRFDYTVVGDAVNVASRLEGISKERGVPLVIGAATVAIVSSDFDFVGLGEIRIRGKQGTEKIYSLSRFAAQGLDRADELASSGRTGIEHDGV